MINALTRFDQDHLKYQDIKNITIFHNNKRSIAEYVKRMNMYPMDVYGKGIYVIFTCIKAPEAPNLGNFYLDP